jgi:hypothetical protein
MIFTIKLLYFSLYFEIKIASDCFKVSMTNRKQNSKLTAWKAFMKRNLCKVEQMNDSDNVALLIWYHYCDVRVNSNTTGATIEAGTDFPSGAHWYAPAFVSGSY